MPKPHDHLDAPRERRRRDWALAILAALVVTAFWMATLADWNTHTGPVLVGRPHGILPTALLAHHPQDGAEPGWFAPEDAPLLRASSLAMDRLGRGYAALTMPQVLLFGVFLAATFACGAIVSGPWVGLAALALASSMPFVAEAALGYDDHLFNMTGVMLCAVLLLLADAFRRLVPSAIAGVVLGSLVRWAFVPSNGVLAAVAVFCLALGAAADFARDHRDVAAARRDAGGGVFFVHGFGRRLAGALVFLAGVYIAALRDGSLAYTSYLVGESDRAIAATRAGAGGLSAYAELIWTRSLGPALTVASLAGLAGLFIGRHRRRLTLVAWLVVPVLFLSLSAKKNIYYHWNALAAAAPVIAVGLASLPLKRRWVGALLGVLCAWSLFSAYSAWYRTVAGDASVPSAFESATSVLPGAPREDAGTGRAEAQAVLAAARDRRDPGEALLLIVPETDDDLEMFHYHLLLLDPDAMLWIPGKTSFVPRAERRPYLLVEKRLVDRGLTALALAQQQSAEADLSPGTDSPRAAYLRDLAARLHGYAPVFETERLVLFDDGDAPAP